MALSRMPEFIFSVILNYFLSLIVFIFITFSHLITSAMS